jgi:hypothetical protein
MYELRGALPGLATLFFERMNQRGKQDWVKERCLKRKKSPKTKPLLRNVRNELGN